MDNIHIFQSQDELIQKTADRFISLASGVIKNRGRFSAVLSGGGTPLPLYRLLAGQHAAALDWDRIHFFWGDERGVPPGHPESNFSQADQALLKPLDIPPENIHRIQGELKPGEAASIYQKEILAWFHPLPPRFDLILLGMGDDGHTASLFPGTPLASGDPADPDLLVAETWVPKFKSWRITFTPGLINSAENILFLVSGGSKSSALKEVLTGLYQPDKFPSQLINPLEGNLAWYLDQDAAADLSLEGMN